MSDDTKQAALWATAVLGSIMIVMFGAGRCTERQDGLTKQFAERCIAQGKTYVPISDKVIGACA